MCRLGNSVPVKIPKSDPSENRKSENTNRQTSDESVAFVGIGRVLASIENLFPLNFEHQPLYLCCSIPEKFNTRGLCV